jgi:predicted metal-binding membrane protein
MLMLFALGHHRLDWMLVLCAVLTAERLAPRGELLARVVGIAVSGLAFWLLMI